MCLWWDSNIVYRLVLPSPGETPTCLLYAGPFPELAQSLGTYFCWIKNLKSIYLAKSLALSNEFNGSPTSDSARHPRPPMVVSGIFMERPCSFWDSFLVRAHFHKIWPMECPKCLLPAYPTHLCSVRTGACEIAKLSGLCAYLLGCMSRAYLCSQDSFLKGVHPLPVPSTFKPFLHLNMQMRPLVWCFGKL